RPVARAYCHLCCPGAPLQRAVNGSTERLLLIIAVACLQLGTQPRFCPSYSANLRRTSAVKPKIAHRIAKPYLPAPCITTGRRYGMIDNNYYSKIGPLCLSFSRSIRTAGLCTLRFTAKLLTLNFLAIARALPQTRTS